MIKFIEGVKAFLSEEEGLTTVEYAVAGALVAAATVTVFTDLGREVCEAIQGLANDVGGAGSSTTAC